MTILTWPLAVDQDINPQTNPIYDYGSGCQVI